jgi:anthranilate synthase component 2
VIRVLIIDNFDSFTHNLAQILGGLGAEVQVRRNHRPLSDYLCLRPERVVLSPGPGGPADAGASLPALRSLAGQVPLLGVCLGMQVLATAYGAKIARAPAPVHGKASALQHDGKGCFEALGQDIAVGRYHSLCVLEDSLPPALEPTAWAGGVLMGIRHRCLPLAGIQFHPESILSPDGEAMLATFLRKGRP